MRTHLPDILSYVRIPLAVLVILSYSDSEKWRFEVAVALILVALATDFFDGIIARRLGLCTKHGYIIDGLGDRAMYVAIWLAFLTKNKIGLLVTWMLVFREVAIYAVRLLSSRWFEVNKSVRFLSRLHAGLIRAWILSVFTGDAMWLYAGVDMKGVAGYSVAMTSALALTLTVSYYSLARHLLAILEEPDNN